MYKKKQKLIISMQCTFCISTLEQRKKIKQHSIQHFKYHKHILIPRNIKHCLPSFRNRKEG